jgi:hypothetical protein
MHFWTGYVRSPVQVSLDVYAMHQWGVYQQRGEASPSNFSTPAWVALRAGNAPELNFTDLSTFRAYGFPSIIASWKQQTQPEREAWRPQQMLLQAKKK